MSRLFLAVSRDVRGLHGNADTTPPTVPGTLAASSITTTTATVTWAASTDNVATTGYNVYNATPSSGGGGGSNPVLLGTTGASPRTFNVTGMQAGQDNIIQVTAFDAAGNESDPGSITITTTGAVDTTPPTVPVNLVQGIVTSTSAAFSWDSSSDDLSGVDHYIVLKNGTQVSVTPDQTPNAVVGSLVASTTYTLTVKAVDAAGNVSAASSGLSVTTAAAVDTTPPGQVVGLNATSVTQTQIGLGWSAQTDTSGISVYKIYWGSGPDGSSPAASTFLKNVTSPALTTSVTGLTASTVYAFAVSAVDGAGNEGTKSGTIRPETLPTTGGGGTGGILFMLQGTNQKAQSGPSTGQSSLTKLGERTAANGWTNASGDFLVNPSGQAINLGGVRGYYGAGTFPTTFDATFATGGSGVNTNKRQQMCFKGGSGWTTFQQWMTQAIDLPFCRWLNSIPDGWEVACTPHHEPQDDFNTTDMTTAQFKAGVMRFAALLENRSMPAGQPVKDPSAPAVSLRTGVKAYMEVCFTVPVTATANKWGDMKNALPLASQLDAQSKVCVDAYQNPPPPIAGSTYPTGNTILGYFLTNVLHAYGYDAAGHGWTIGEWMCPARDGNPGGQAAAVTEYLNYCENRAVPAGWGPAGGPPYAIRMWEDRFGEVDGSGAKFDQTASAATKAVFVTHANGPNART